MENDYGEINGERLEGKRQNESLVQVGILFCFLIYNASHERVEIAQWKGCLPSMYKAPGTRKKTLKIWLEYLLDK